MAVRPTLGMPNSSAPSPAAPQAPDGQLDRGHRNTRAKTPRPSTRVGKRAAVAWLEPEAVKQLGIMAIQEETTVQDLLAEAIDLLFAKHGKHRLAVSR
jgi:hypothetical protein